ncbi:hypothetical protein BH09MYX1_BH09MYX1_37200 [soil metagenome]
MTSRRALFPFVLLLALGVACGGASSPPASAPRDYDGESGPSNPPPSGKTPSEDQVSAPGTNDETNQSAGTAPSTYPSGTAPVPPLAPTARAPDARRSWALATLGDAERPIEASMKECSTACKALASMERAAKTLCDLGDPAECSRAKARVDAARDKVRKTCGACAT